jgi:hypothetical protein
MWDFFLYVYVMKTNIAIRLLAISVVIAFCHIQTQYGNEPSSSIMMVVCFLLKQVNWEAILSDHGTRIFILAAIGIFALNFSILTAAFANRKGLLFGISLFHVGFWFFLWNCYGSFIILASVIPYFILATTLVGLLVMIWLNGKLNKNRLVKPHSILL